jgi:hypothetical protein
MPRRQAKKEVPRWRRGKTPHPVQVIQIKGRKARTLMRTLDDRQQAGTQKPANGAVPVNDALAATGAWRRRRQFPPVAWGAGVVILGAALRATPHPFPFGILAGAAFAALLIGFTRHCSVFTRRWSDAAAFLAAAWVPALAAAGFSSPVPVALTLTWLLLAAPWWKHYAIRPAEPEPEEDPSADGARWERLAARKRWSGQLGQRADIPGGRKYEILLDGAETHIGDVLSQPRAIAAAWDRAMTEAYAEPHGTGVESRGTLTLLSRGTLEQVREWDGKGFNSQGIARIGRFADSAHVRIRILVPRDGTRHGLVAGTSGGGKSELLNGLIWLGVTGEIPVVPVILDPQNGQSLPQWRDKVLYASGVEECARMMRGLHAGMMDRSRRLASMTWDDEGHRVRGMSFFDTRLSGLPVVMPIIDESPLLLSGDGNAKVAADMVRLTAEGGKLGRKTGVSLWLVAQVPSLAELGGDQALRSMLVGGNVICLRTGDRVSAGMIGLEADPSALPKYFPDGEPTQGIGYAVTLDNRQAPMRTDIVPSRMRHQPVTVPHLEDEFLEVMDRVMAKGAPLANVAPLQQEAPADDGPEGRRCVDAVWLVLQRAGAEMERGEIIAAAGAVARDEWGRDKPYSIRAIGDALRDLSSGKYPDRPVMKPRDGVYEALAPRGDSEVPETITDEGGR